MIIKDRKYFYVIIKLIKGPFEIQITVVKQGGIKFLFFKKIMLRGS
jgi:hypothetical protein